MEIIYYVKHRLFNICKDYQFTTRIKIESESMDMVTETKLLGVIVNNQLTWDENTKHLVRKANARMRILHKLVSYDVPREDNLARELPRLQLCFIHFWT